MRGSVDAQRNWRWRRREREEADRALSLDLTTEGGELFGSSQDSSAFSIFHTAKSCLSTQVASRHPHSYAPGYESINTISSDLVPNVTIILPPCSSIGEDVAVDVHIEHPVSTDGNYHMVCMMKGLQMASVALSPTDGLSVRMHIPQLAIGVVDFFVLKTTSSPSSYSGAAGHLLVLPEAEARDANAMFTRLVDIALQDPGDRIITATISEEQEEVVPRSRSCNDMPVGVCPPVQSLDYPRGTEDVPGPSAFAAVLYDQDEPPPTPAMTIELPPSLHNIPPLMASFRVLNIQKWIWSEHFIPFALELEALLHTVGLPLHESSSASISQSVSESTALQLGPVFVEVLENILAHLRKFDAWELIAFVLKTSMGAGVAILWEGKKLNRDLLTGQRLKDLARDPASGTTLIDDTNPGPSGLGTRDPEYPEGLRHGRRLFASATTHERGDPGLAGISAWSAIRVVDDRDPTESRKGEKKSRGRITGLIRKLSTSIKSIHQHTKIDKEAENRAEPPDETLPTIESGQLLGVNLREDSASRRRLQPTGRQSKKRSKTWESIRRRFFKTDSAHTEGEATRDSHQNQPAERKSTSELFPDTKCVQFDSRPDIEHNYRGQEDKPYCAGMQRPPQKAQLVRFRRRRLRSVQEESSRRSMKHAFVACCRFARPMDRTAFGFLLDLLLWRLAHVIQMLQFARVAVFEADTRDWWLG